MPNAGLRYANAPMKGRRVRLPAGSVEYRSDARTAIVVDRRSNLKFHSSSLVCRRSPTVGLTGGVWTFECRDHWDSQSGSGSNERSGPGDRGGRAPRSALQVRDLPGPRPLALQGSRGFKFRPGEFAGIGLAHPRIRDRGFNFRFFSKSSPVLFFSDPKINLKIWEKSSEGNLAE